MLGRGAVDFSIRVIPGISSVAALAAQHQISLTRTGRPLHLTTGRRLAEGFPDNADDVLVMLDARNAFETADGDDEIYWGAYVGSADEIVISGAGSPTWRRGDHRRARGRARAARLDHGHVPAAPHLR